MESGGDEEGWILEGYEGYGFDGVFCVWEEVYGQRSKSPIRTMIGVRI